MSSDGPRLTTLLVDLDYDPRFQNERTGEFDPAKYRQMARSRLKLAGFFVKGPILIQDSVSGGKHAILTLTQPVSPIWAVFLQLLIGDDYKRSALNACRVRLAGDDGKSLIGQSWNVLFNSKVTIGVNSTCPVLRRKKQ